MGKPSGSTLATWLSDLEVDRLERVLAARPDAVSLPEPRSFGELADRLQRPASVAPVLPGLALPHLQVAEALAALGPVPCAALADLLDATGTESTRGLDAALDALADRALVWPDGEGLLRMATPLRQAWDSPLGLDAPLTRLLADTTSEELRRMLVALGIPPPGTTKKHRLTALLEHHSNPERVAAVIASAPVSTRKLLERRASHQGEPAQSPARLITFRAPSADSEPAARWALERGLLIQDRYSGYGSTRMPAEVALALRGAGWHAPFDPVPPVVRTASVTSAEVDREAAAAATAFAAHAASVLATCSAAPPVLLKSGGIGARELSRISKAAQCDDIVVRLVLETAYDAGLLAQDGDRVAATDGYDNWAEREPAAQLTALLHTWRTLPLTPTQARDEDGKVLPALAGTPPCGGCRQAREGLLAAAAQLPADRGVHSPAELGPLVAWHRSLAEQLPQDTTPFATAIREAELLGVVARGALSPIGAALRTDDAEALSAACERLLPTATRAARFGADLTAVVTGTPSARLAALLDSVADKEVGGTASVWRFSPTTVRRALDTGRTADAIAADLSAVAVGALPQSLSYLINDSARTHGRVRITPAACVIHSEEPALLAELVTHRKLAALGLRLLAPTVLVSRTPLDKTLATLRAAGYAPVAERADGTVRVEKTRRRRTAAPAPPPPPLPGQRRRSVPTVTPVTVDLSTLAARLRAAPPILPAPDPFGTGVPYGTDTEEIVAGCAKNLAYSDVRQLAHAIDSGTAITVEYVAASGNRTVRTLSELVLDPPYLYAWCHLRDDERVFALSRIHDVMPG
ncbi:helicase-associated domain-containing protein [Streptomyces sp. NPDC059166]|uniref:WYL domain-containing protein n=1 Tax=Streptomyces sp. NPDC059166 TaxID=3346752 RepID=UPI003696086F